MNGLRGAFSDFSARWNLALVATNDLCVWLSEKNDMQKKCVRHFEWTWFAPPPRRLRVVDFKLGGTDESSTTTTTHTIREKGHRKSWYNTYRRKASLIYFIYIPAIWRKTKKHTFLFTQTTKGQAAKWTKQTRSKFQTEEKICPLPLR